MCIYISVHTYILRFSSIYKHIFRSTSNVSSEPFEVAQYPQQGCRRGFETLVCLLRILLRCTKYSRVRQATLLTYKAPLILRKVLALDNAQLQFYSLHLFKVAVASCVLPVFCCISPLLYLPVAVFLSCNLPCCCTCHS